MQTLSLLPGPASVVLHLMANSPVLRWLEATEYSTPLMCLSLLAYWHLSSSFKDVYLLVSGIPSRLRKNVNTVACWSASCPC